MSKNVLLTTNERGLLKALDKAAEILMSALRRQSDPLGWGDEFREDFKHLTFHLDLVRRAAREGRNRTEFDLQTEHLTARERMLAEALKDARYQINHVLVIEQRGCEEERSDALIGDLSSTLDLADNALEAVGARTKFDSFSCRKHRIFPSFE